MFSPKKKMQVFVSSTYEDMKTERQAAVMAILDAGHIPAGMELFAANDKSQWNTIEKWIEESDVFLLILGGRYGTIEATSGTSYIELEFDHAVKIGKPFFSVVISEKCLKNKVSDAGTDAMERADSKKWSEFRAKVEQRQVSSYDDEKDIALAIHKSLSDYEKDDKIGGWIRISDSNSANLRYVNGQDVALSDSSQQLTKSADILSADFDVQFYNKETQALSGTSLSVNHQFIQKPDHIPNFTVPEFEQPYNGFIRMPTLEKANMNYYREYADLFYKNFSFFPVYLAVKNTGKSNAENVRIEITISVAEVCDVFEEYELPDEDTRIPPKTISHLDMITPHLDVLRRRNNADGELEISRDANSHHVETEYRHIQSGRTVYLEPIFISKNQSGQIAINGTVYSQAEPISFSVSLDCTIDARELTMEMIDKIGKE